MLEDVTANYEKIEPDYRLPIFVPVCPVHKIRMYVNRHENRITRFRCQHKGCNHRLKVSRVKHIPITSIPVELRDQITGD